MKLSKHFRCIELGKYITVYQHLLNFGFKIDFSWDIDFEQRYLISLRFAFWEIDFHF